MPDSPAGQDSHQAWQGATLSFPGFALACLGQEKRSRSPSVLRFLRRLFSVNYFSGLRGLFLLAHCVTQIVIRAS